MIGRKVTIKDNINLHDLGIVEVADYNLLNIESIYKERADAPSYLQKKKRVTKSITLNIRVIKKNIAEVRKKIDEIVGLSYSGEPFSFLIDEDKYCRATLESADKSELWNSGLLTLEFTNLDGLWYGEEKIANLGSSFTVNSLIPTTFLIIKLTPTSVSPGLTFESKKMRFENALAGRIITIDNNKKTATQLNEHVTMSLDSDFFILENKRSVISATGGSGTITYREVVAL